MQKRFEIEIDYLFGDGRRESGVADADEAVVGENFDDQPTMEGESLHGSLRESSSRSMGLVQKCGGKGTVLPRQRTTRVRISLIFMALLASQLEIAS